MTNLLVKMFIKDYKDIQNSYVRSSYGMLASIVGIIANVLLFFVKLAIGFFLHSVSVMADAINNLSDAASSIISFVGVKMASKPADKDHPFGHGRIEYISAFIVAFIILQVGFSFFQSAINKIRTPEDIVFNGISIIILALSVVVKLWLGFFNYTLGKRINSTMLKATSTDSFGDVIATLFTIVSIIVYKIFAWNIDGYVGILVSILVMYAGFNIAKDTLAPLIGEAVDPEFIQLITDKVEGYEGIVGSHDLIVHNYGPMKSMASIHVEVPNDVDIETSHEIIDTIEREVLKELNLFLVIHMDPIETKDERVLFYKNMVLTILFELDEELKIHDFRMVDGKERINLIFDLVVPYKYNESQIENLENMLSEHVKEMDHKCACVVTVEKSLTGEK